MTNYVFVDTVLQVFESDGNLHIIGGVANGEVDAKGKDILEKTLHLTMPLIKAQKILPDIAASLPKISLPEPGQSTSSQQDSLNNKNEFEGNGLHFKI
jgi:hypothetical protein